MSEQDEFTDLGDTMGSHNAWSSFQPYRDTTTRSHDAYKAFDAKEETDSDVSDLPELSKTQEVELRRWGRCLPNPQEMQPQNGRPLEESMEQTSFQDNWKPSVDMTGDTDEPVSPKRVSWPHQDDLASTLKSNRGSVRTSTELIPDDVRKQTPRATGYTNKVMMLQSAEPALGGAKALDVGNIQTNLRHTTRDMVRERNMQPDLEQTVPKQIDDTPPQSQMLGETTRGRVRGYNQQTESDETIPKQIDDTPLRNPRQTTRDMVRDRNLETDTCPTIPQPIVETPLRIDDQYDEDKLLEKGIPCWSKCLVCGAVSAIFLAGIIAMAVLLKENEPSGQHGSVVPDPVAPRECNDVYVSLGESITFTCVFAEGHDAREDIRLARNVAVYPPNKISAATFKPDHIADYSWNVQGPVATCSTQGTYRFNFLDLKGKTVHSSSVSLIINTSEAQTSIRQTSTGDEDAEFHVTCDVSRDCNNYDVNFVGSKNNKTVSLNAFKECSSSFSDAEGYTKQCVSTFNGNETDFTDTYPLCRLSRRAVDKTEPFELPPCQPLEDCEKDCPDANNNDICNSVEARNCFSPALPLFLRSQSGICMLGYCVGTSGSVTNSMTVQEALCAPATTASTAYNVTTIL